MNYEMELEKWLGTEEITIFETEEEVRAHFTAENAEYMWGPGDYSDAEDLAGFAVDLWTKTKTTIAKNIISSNDNYTDVMTAADAVAVDRDQDWEHETTIFEFKDGSRIRVDGKMGETTEG